MRPFDSFHQLKPDEKEFILINKNTYKVTQYYLDDLSGVFENCIACWNMDTERKAFLTDAMHNDNFFITGNKEQNKKTINALINACKRVKQRETV